MRKIRLILTSILIAACAFCALAGCTNRLPDDGQEGNNNSDNNPSDSSQTVKPTEDYSAGLAYTAIVENGETVGYEVSLGKNNTKKVVIPNEYQSLPVRKIAEKGFENNKNMETITIPSNVVEIGRDAFKGCDNLTSAVFAEVNDWLLTGLPEDYYFTISESFLSKPDTAAIHLLGNYDCVWKRVASGS